MKKTYRIRKKRKTIGTIYIFIIILAILLSLSVGYSMFSSNLQLLGTVSISKQSTGGGGSGLEIPTEISNCAVSYIIEDSWPVNEGGIAYRVSIKITNMDENEDITEWTISLDLPPYINVDNINAWDSSETTVIETEECDRITQKSHPWNGSILYGETRAIGFVLYFTEDVEFDIKRLIINNKLVTNIVQEAKVTY